MVRRFFLTASCLLVLVALGEPAHAYIDPAAGSLFLQVLIAGVAGLLLTLKLFWRRMADFLTRKKTGAEEPEE